MDYDLNIVLPVCSKFRERLEDFKRYGIVNTGGRRVLLSLLLSNETLAGLQDGWNTGIETEVIHSEVPDHVSNLYRFFATMDVRARWTMRVDDDSCTDVDGLLNNLDKFYDPDAESYLGTSLKDFGNLIHSREGELYPQYSHLLGDYKIISKRMKVEMECCVVSHAAMKRIRSNKPSMDLLRGRSRFYGGYGDCVLAISSAMAKVFPVDCPFLTHLPLVDEFSVAGGALNHIHLVSRVRSGENFHSWDRASPENYILLTKIVDDNPSPLEKSVGGSRFLFEDQTSLRTYDFERHRLKIKFEERDRMWMEHEGKIVVLLGNEVVHRFEVMEDNSLSDGNITLKKIGPSVL